MAFQVQKQEYKGTKLDGPPMPAGINPATLTAVKDLGMVKVDPKYPRQDGKTEVHQAEFVFTGANGTQVKKDATVSLHEKAFINKLIVAMTGTAPGESFDLETLIGKNVVLLTEIKVSQKGKQYSKITGVAPAQAGQPVFSAPAPSAVPKAAVPATTNVGF